MQHDVVDKCFRVAFVLYVLVFAVALFAQSSGSVTFTAATVNPAQMAVVAGTGTSAVSCTVKGNAAIPAATLILNCQIGPNVVLSGATITLTPGLSLPLQLTWGANEADLSVSVPTAGGASTVTGTAKVSGTVQQTQTGQF